MLYGLSGDALSYLRRWLNSNLVFGDDIYLTGILPDGRFVISQLMNDALAAAYAGSASSMASGWRSAMRRRPERGLRGVSRLSSAGSKG
jgi:hypothetical protein